MSETAQLEGAVWIGAKVLAADIPVSDVAARALLPPELELEDPTTATIFVADYPETTFGSVYREAAVILHAKDEKGHLRHCPWMVVDDDTALILGRELLGFPKKMADISLKEEQGRIIGVVTRKGAEVIRIEGELGPIEPSPKPLFAHRMVNLFGSIVGGMKLLDIPAAKELIHTARSVSGKVLLGTSDRDQLGALGTSTECNAIYMTMDFGGSGAMELPEVSKDVDPTFALGRFFTRAM